MPTGADSTNTDPAGGVHNAGLVDIRNLSLGGLNSYIEIEYQVRPAPVLPNLSYIQNQAQVLIGTTQVALSDDPTVNGAADPLVAGDEDPTRVQIHSAPYFRVHKISTDLDGNPAVLLAGERLRYTITVKNIGTDNAVDARLRDALPLDTTYIPGSTTLNGTAIADAAGNTLPLTAGIDLYAPENTTPGAMRADASTTTANVATVTFEVRVDPLVANQTVISNQGYVSAVTGGVVDQPSDDPRTPVANDPTRNVVGNYPLLFAEKSAVLQVDNDSPGIVDPTDYLLYTIKVYNNGNIAGTMARLVDEVPNDTTYVADTLTLNGLPVGQPDNGVFPLADGIWISTSDLTPPLPGPNEGTLSPHESATVTFQMRVNDATPRGTQIVNQATVSTAEVASRLTDGDGNPATGPEPTVVVVGDAQVLTITKEVLVVGGGPAIAGATLDYLVTVRNPSVVPATDVYVSDNLDETFPGYLLYVDQSAMLNNSANGVSVAGAVITANFSTVYGPLMPGQSFQLRFRAQIAPTLAIGTKVTNVAHVTWNTDQTAYATNVIDVGGMVGSGILNGNVWHDSNFDDVLDPNERVLEGWTVELRRNDQPIASTTTDSEGAWRISGVVPNYLTQNRYDLFFRAPGASSSSALLGRAASAFTQRTAAHLRHPGAVGQQPARPQSADRPGRHRLQLDLARTAIGDDGDDARRGQRHRGGGGVFRRPEPARPGHAQRRLLQVRHQLLGSELSERRELSPRSRAARGRLRNGTVARHSAGQRSVVGVRRTELPRWRVRRDPHDRDVLRSAAVRIRAAARRARAQRRHRVPHEHGARRFARAGFEGVVQQPHRSRPDVVRRRADQQDDADGRRDSRPDGAVHDHRPEYVAIPADRHQRRRPLSDRLQVHRRLRALRQPAPRTDRRRSPAAVAGPHAGC